MGLCLDIPQRNKVKFVTTVMNDLRHDLELFVDIKRCRVLAVLALHPSPIDRKELAELAGLDPNVGETGRMLQELERLQYIVPVERNRKPKRYLITREARELAETIIGTFFFAAENKVDDPKWRPHRQRLLEFCGILRESLKMIEPTHPLPNNSRISGSVVIRKR